MPAVYDFRFDEKLFQSFPGKTFHKYRCDPFIGVPKVYAVIGIYIGDKVYRLSNFTQVMDYDFHADPIAVNRFEETEDSAIVSAVNNMRQVDMPREGTIEKVTLVNEHQVIRYNGTKAYEIWVTRAVIFTIDGTELSFEKDSWPYSEELEIHEGKDLRNSLSDVNEFSYGWEEGVTAKAEREEIVFSLEKD